MNTNARREWRTSAEAARRVGFSVILALVAGGCSQSDGPRLGTVRGTVTLDDAPLAGAIVVFTPAVGGRQSFAQTNDQGEYELTYLRATKGAVLGQHRVTITTANEDSPEERIPARYNSATTLGFVVKPGNNDAPFDLSTK